MGGKAGGHGTPCPYLFNYDIKSRMGRDTESDVMIRYEGDEVVGLTILHASKR